MHYSTKWLYFVSLILSKKLCYYGTILFFPAHPKLDYDNRLKGVQNIKAGTTLVLPVNIDGIPSPTISWMLDEEPIEKSARVTMDTTDKVTTLTIKNTMLDDTGMYTVEAENTVGKAVADFEVNVRGESYFPFVSKNNETELVFFIGVVSTYC